MRRVPLPASRAGRALVALWAAVLLAAAVLVATLQWLGPPARPTVATAPAKPQPLPARLSAAAAPPAVKVPAAPAVVASGRGDITRPDPALLEPALLEPGMMLPRISHDGREAARLYAAPAPAVPAGARPIAILLDGVGLSSADSFDAIDSLPSAVSLAVSPYAAEPGAVLDAARKAGHELLLSLPMEPAGAPADDEGTKALTMQVDPDENLRRLDWSLSRIQGYAGVTNASSGLNGENFAGSPQFAAVAHALAGRGLFYVDATPDAPVPDGIAGVDADLRFDTPPDAAGIDRQLAQLERVASGKGSAIGVVGPVYPITVRRLADWARTLPARGLVLVPVSSLVRPATEAASRSVR
jgi:polysaccharide deacetylase 2 family uncharacterized protein YibQ